MSKIGHLFLSFSAVIVLTSASATTPVKIDSRLSVISDAGATPNVFFTLDDSGSMNALTPSGTSRRDVMVASLKKALSDYQGKLRIGAQTLNATNTFGLIPARLYTPSVKRTFEKWLNTVKASGGTPLRTAAAKVRNAIVDANHTTNDVFLNEAKTKRLWCRKNYSILLADGMWNGPSPKPRDNRNIHFNDERRDQLDNRAYDKWNGKPPKEYKALTYKNPESRLVVRRSHPDYTLVDIALRDWIWDLARDLPDKQTPFLPHKERITPGGNYIRPFWVPGNDQASHQHITTYTMGISIGEELTEEEENAIFDGNASWDPFLDDFRHTSYAGAGLFYRVEDEKDMVEAFNHFFEDILEKSEFVSLTGTVISERQLDEEEVSRAFSTDLDFFSRQGNLKGTLLYDGNNAKLCFGSDRPEKMFVGQLCTEDSAMWSANKQMKPHDKRKIYTINNQKEGAQGIQFLFSEMNDSQKSRVSRNQPISGNDVVNYIRGSSEKESAQRVREREPNSESSGMPVLGDIGRGKIVYVGKPNTDYWPKTSKSNYPENRTPMIYVGANDGMLHGFSAETGEEKFAYVPNMLFDKFSNLVKEGEKHQAFVDGQIVVQDIAINKGTEINPILEYKTILVSGIGSGGKGLFALDITNPDNFNERNVLWELDGNSAKGWHGKGIIGNIMGKPSIIRVEGEYKGKKDRWVVVFGTGYNQDSKYSAIVVVDLLSGEVLQNLILPNSYGVSEITWIDHQKHKDKTLGGEYLGEKDRGYVGDAAGHIWALDFSADENGKTELKSVLRDGTKHRAPMPFFHARDNDYKPQAITHAPLVVRHPINRGYLVYFGTGSLFANKEIHPGTTNSMYAIWDDVSEDYGDVNIDDVPANHNLIFRRGLLHNIEWEQQEGILNDGKTEAEYRAIKHGKRIQWANRFPNTPATHETYKNTTGDDSKFPASRKTRRYAKGWVADVGRNSKLVSERVYQKPYLVKNEDGENHVVFLMHDVFAVQNNGGESCEKGTSSSKTWQMSFNIDKEEGPASYDPKKPKKPSTDVNGDGKIDNGDGVKGKNVLGALSKKDDNNGIIFRPQKTTSKSGKHASCKGTVSTYTASNSASKKNKQYTVCNPDSSTSWREVE